jgi:hypothetical protein
MENCVGLQEADQRGREASGRSIQQTRKLSQSFQIERAKDESVEFDAAAAACVSR